MSAKEWDVALVIEFQAAVRKWLDRTNLSQQQAAYLCGFSQSVLNRWMSTDPEFLVQPQPPLLRKLAPKINIPLSELLRMAGHSDMVLAIDKPRELLEFLRDQEAGYWASAENERPIRMDVARSALPIARHVRRRSNRRVRGNNEGLDRPNADYGMHKLVA